MMHKNHSSNETPLDSDAGKAPRMSKRKFLAFGLATTGAVVAGVVGEKVMRSATEKTKREQAWNESKESVARLVSEFDLQPEAYAIVVNPEKQELYVIQNNAVVEIYPISTSIKGIGTRSESEKTPWGTHRIKEKIGDEVEVGTVFVAREPTEKVVEPITSPIDTNEDLVTTRIMWLEGEEPNINQGSGVDSHSRYIYIHGTPEEGLIGQPASHGCIRMKNDDVVKLFNTVPTGTLVEIQAREYR